MFTPLQRIQHLLSAVEGGQVLLADATMEAVFSKLPRDVPRVLAALQLAGRVVGALRAAAASDGAAQASDLQAIAQALEISLQQLGLSDPTCLPTALEPMFTFDVTFVAAVTVSAPDEQDARKKITGALATSRAILGNWADGAPILSTVHTDDRGLDIGPCYMVVGAAKPLVGAFAQELPHV